MSTRPDDTYETTTASGRTDESIEGPIDESVDEPSDDPIDFSRRDPDSDGAADSPRPDAEPASWIERCQRQFDSTDDDRLGNLADEANEAMPDGV